MNAQSKIGILAVLMLFACIIVNFAAYRMAISFQVSFATTSDEIINAKAIAFALTTFSLVFSTITVHFYHEKAYAIALLCLALTAMVFVYETHGAWGYFAELNKNFEQNSDAAKMEKMNIDLASKKLEILETGKVDAGQAQKRLAQLQKQVLTKEDAASKCGLLAFKCKNKALSGADKISVEINSLNAQLDTQDKYISAINDAQKTIKKSESNDNEKAHPVFKMLSMFFYEDIGHAKLMQANALVAIGVLIILLAEFSPAIAYRLIHQNEPIKQALNNNQSYSTPIQNQNENPPYPTWRNGGINGWQALQRRQSNRANANANQVTASVPENAVTMNADAPVNLVRPNADAPIEPFYGTSELATFENAEPTPPPASEYIVDGVGFGASVRRNPAYVAPNAPIIHWQTSNPAGVEIVGSDTDADSDTPPSLSECVRMDAPSCIHTDADAATPDADAVALNADADALEKRTGGGNGRGDDSLMDYADLKNAVLHSDYLLKDDGTVGQNRVEKYMGVGRPKAKKYMDRLIADGIISADLKPLFIAEV